jgi:glycogen(starch) synthase
MINSTRRVLMTADAVGGVFGYALELARALAPHRVQVGLAVMGAPLARWQQSEIRSIGNVEVFESDFKLEWMEHPWDDIARAGEWLLALEEELKPDIVHLNGYCHAALCWQAPVLVAGHSCVLSWWQAVKGEPAPDCWNRYAAEVRRGVQHADGVVAPSRFMQRALNRCYGPLPACRVIYNGRDPAMFSPAPKESLAAKELFVLFAGRVWDEAKNAQALLRIAPRLRAPLQLAGEPGYQAGIQNADFLGPLSQSDLARVYARAAVCALPAHYEPFGLCALEAGLSGCALVLGDIPSYREIWGDCALFAAPDDEHALATTINSLLTDEDMRLAYGRRARKRALEYSAERMAAGYLGFYSELISTRYEKRGLACAL